MVCKHENSKSLYSFDDIIDGYFPLKFSLLQLLDRLDTSLAYIEISHAPIMEIYGLGPHDPVPLRINTGRVGIIDKLHVRITRTGDFSSTGKWQWLDLLTHERTFDSMIRLAEPAYVKGFCTTDGFGSCSGKTAKLIFQNNMPKSGAVWGPFSINHSLIHQMEAIERNFDCAREEFLEISEEQKIYKSP